MEVTSERRVRLRFKNEALEMSYEASKFCGLITEMVMDDDDPLIEVPIGDPDTTPESTKLMIEWCEHHAQPGNPVPKIAAPLRNGSLKESMGPEFEWDVDFITGIAEKSKDRKELHELTLAANYYVNDGLLDLCTAMIASLMYNKSPDEVRKAFGVEETPTPEEEEEIRNKNEWVFDFKPLVLPGST